MSSYILEVAAHSEWQSGVQTHSQIRDFKPVIMDEPAILGGANQGPNPLEYLVASLNGCKGVMIPLIAKELSFQFTALSFATKGVIDLRGLLGQPEVSTHFQSLHFTVTIQTEESAERLQELQDTVSRRCPIYNLLQEAKVNLHSQWLRQ
ncbi:OsmC family protein [Rheinheimera sp. MMS21-TC3]|uniref:OsmC family protein n=1 Tax=Rheinheimera sp. MMS21-TC3 TaxID=3072790 RepID=UPI0028C3F0F1|nr:OsmC family protein [Rheinheimera sp. MMS21-TC3]WNO60163.1 OsmC family protein [Rheinheimera sp. MMS21-TC3]